MRFPSPQALREPFWGFGMFPFSLNSLIIRLILEGVCLSGVGCFLPLHSWGFCRELCPLLPFLLFFARFGPSWAGGRGRAGPRASAVVQGVHRFCPLQSALHPALSLYLSVLLRAKNRVLGRGCEEAEICEEKRFLTE